MLICLVNPCFADITTVNDFVAIKNILESADKDTLVIFDVDDVLVQPTDQIFQSKNKKYLLQLDKALAKRISADKLEYLRSKIAYKQQEKLVDAGILELLAYLKQFKINTTALTNCATGKIGAIARFEEWRIARLNSLGIDFSAHNTLPDVQFQNIDSREGRPVIKSGIIFTGYADKGTVLRAVLRKFSLHPKKIIFIDDKLANLQSVEAVALQHKIEFIGVEYTAVKTSLTDEFNSKRADLQFVVLEREHNWLSDQEADARMNGL